CMLWARSVSVFLVLLLSSRVAARHPLQPSAADPSQFRLASARTILDKYCVACHNERVGAAGVAIDTLDLEHVAASAETWERVIRTLRTETMPPAGRLRPDSASYVALSSWLETAIDSAAAANPNPGQSPAVH